MIIGFVAAVANGVTLPFFALIFGEMTDAFKPGASNETVIKAAGE